MGNTGSNGGGGRPWSPPPLSMPVPIPVPIPVPYDHNHRAAAASPNAATGEFPPSAHSQHYPGWAGRYSYGLQPLMLTPYVEHQKAVTIRNDVNLKKETLRIEPSED